MKNKRIELILNNELICSISKRAITEYVEKLEKENAELKQQLQEKDKAFDKACNELSERHYYEFDSLQTKEDWKEWVENETN